MASRHPCGAPHTLEQDPRLLASLRGRDEAPQHGAQTRKARFEHVHGRSSHADSKLPSLEGIPLPAKLGFACVSVISMFFGFIAWYAGLCSGGIAKMGQLQLLQPFLTLLWSALLLGETLPPTTWWAASVVVLCIALQISRPKVRLQRCVACNVSLP